MTNHPWLQPIVFADGRALPTRILPGPMEGVTEGSFLSAMSKRHFVNAWFTPFLRISTAVPRRSRLQRWLEPYLRNGTPVIAQLMGVDSAKLASAAAILHGLGATCVDLNCACPSPSVLSNGGGGKRLCDPDWINRTLNAMREACGNRAISVKIRVGFDSPEELPAIAAAIRSAQPALVFCHCRTVRELYRPISDGRQRLAKARDLLPDCLLIGNGDILCAEDAEAMRQKCAVDGVIAARGLLRNPALLRDIHDHCLDRPPTPLSDSERLDFLRDIADAPEQGPGAKHGFVLRIAAGLYGHDSALFHELARCRNLRQANEYLHRLNANVASTAAPCIGKDPP
ncbi:MAG: tRNA-dihydrouridine synthase family protein [Lentisphaeria bacterium]|jgi:tRNA-dihydrouridine synthase C